MDARFEREDREKEAERKRVELEAIRARLKREEEDRQRSGADGGVRYKGYVYAIQISSLPCCRVLTSF